MSAEQQRLLGIVEDRLRAIRATQSRLHRQAGELEEARRRLLTGVSVLEVEAYLRARPEPIEVG